MTSNLHHAAVIERLDYKETPPQVEYSLTAFGRTLAKALGIDRASAPATSADEAKR